MTSSPPTNSSDDTTALLLRDRPPSLEDLDGQLHLAQLRRELASAVAEPVRFRQWDVERRLGHGGMGSVYLARHRQLGRLVALKVLSPRADRATSVNDARLVREAQALATIHHKNVVQVHQVDTSGEQTVIEMEYIDGLTLRAWQAGRSWREIVSTYADSGDGLAAIHRAGLVHRDIKPDNILRGHNGTTKVADLGLAVAVQGVPSAEPRDAPPLSVRLTVEGAIVGTLGYIAPEVIVGAPASVASDLFSLAASLYEAVHGVLPFQGDTAEAHAAAIRTGKLTQPAGAPSRPAWLALALRRALECDPARRQTSVDVFVTELRRGLHRRRRRVSLALVGAAVIGLPGLTWWLSAPPANPCPDAGGPFLTLWGPAAREQLQNHADAASAPPISRSLELLTHTLDDTTQSLASTATRLCEAERSIDISAPIGHRVELDLNARQRVCLDHAYRHIRALVDRLLTFRTDLARHYTDATATIEALPRCEDPQDLVHWPLSPETGELDARLGEMLAQAAALEVTGDYTGAARLAELVLQASEPVSRRRRAEALYRRGHILGEQHRYSEAYRTLVEAREVAYGSGHDELFCQAGMFLAKLAANVGLDPATSARELGLANACAERIDARSILLRADLLEARGLLAFVAGDPERAVRWHREALALRRGHLGDLNHHTAKSRHNLANALAANRHDAEARQSYDAAIALHEQLFGLDHVEVADVLFDFGEFLCASDPDEARTLLARASAIYAREPAIFGPASANIHIMLALLDIRSAEPPEAAFATAAEHLRQAHALQRDETLDPNHPDRAQLLRAEGALALGRKDFSGSVQAYARATRMLARHGAADSEIFESILFEIEAAYGREDFAAIARHARDEGQPLVDHLRSVEPVSDRGQLAWYIGDSLARQSSTAESVAYLQIAYTTYQGLSEPAYVAELGWQIAQAIVVATPTRVDEARGLASASLTHYLAIGERTTSGQISRWLERNAPSPRPTTSTP